MTKLERISKTAQDTANREGKSCSVYNLNPHNVMYVIREVGLPTSRGFALVATFTPQKP